MKLPFHWSPVGCLLILVSDVACSAQSTPKSANPWSVTTVRERRADEIPFERATGYLREPQSRNFVPGPDSLVARVSIIERKGYVEVLDLRTGAAERLLDAWASLPQWSPDGRFISCVAWRSVLKHHELTVIEVATKRLVADPDVRASGTNAKWSPDSRMIAAAGVTYASPRCLMYVVSIPDGAATVIDSTDVLMSPSFSWSPDGRWLAYAKPTELDHLGEDPLAADLWIADPTTGKTWLVLATPEWVEMAPLWVTNRTILVTRSLRQGDQRGSEQSVVIEITHEEDTVSEPD